jgi:glutaredoxin
VSAARVMYVKPNCPYCEEARVALRADGVEFEERDATSRDDWRAELMRHSRDTGKVPTIVMGDEVVTIGWKGRG